MINWMCKCCVMTWFIAVLRKVCSGGQTLGGGEGGGGVEE